MKNTEARAIIRDLRDRPDVWRLVYSEPLDVQTARRSGAVARALNYGALDCPEHVYARSETTSGSRARVWAIWRSSPTGWQHRAMAERPHGPSGPFGTPSCEACGYPRPMPRTELMLRFHWTAEQVADIPDHLLLAVLDA